MKSPKTVCFYRGPSQLDGKPVIALMSGLSSYMSVASRNTKTGAMAQTWILREDQDPIHAAREGEDESVCGQCPLRTYLANGTGKAMCYVTTSLSILGTRELWRSYHASSVPFVAPESAQTLVRGKMVRLGAYGDPAAVPLAVWEALLQEGRHALGYTHQWRTCDVRYRRWCMASCDSVADREEAHRLGYRTFRVQQVLTVKSLPGEVRCPGSQEAGKKLTCAQCKACDGTATGRRSDILIAAHGFNRNKHVPQAALIGEEEYA